MGKYSIVIFDLDGTLTDPGAGIVSTIRSVIAELGGKAPRAEELKWCVGPPLREIFTRLLAPAGKEEREGRAELAEAAGKEGGAELEGERGLEDTARTEETAESERRDGLVVPAGKEERAKPQGTGGSAEMGGEGDSGRGQGKDELAAVAKTGESTAASERDVVRRAEVVRAESEGRGGWGAAAGTDESKAPSVGEAVGRASALYLQRYAESGAAESVAYQGVNQMLTELRKVARLFVVTSKNTATAERILGMCGLKRYFEEVIGNGRLNDKSDMVRDLIDRERIERATAAMVGDREFDIRAGKNNGIFSIGVTYGYGSREELEAAGAGRICESPAEVARLLLSAGG